MQDHRITFMESSALSNTDADSSLSHDGNCSSSVDCTRGGKAGVVKKPDCEESSNVHVNDLFDVCLEKIFSYLEMYELARIERVCKKWQHVCWGMWRSLKHVSLREILPESLHGNISMNMVKSITERCGEHATHLDISYKGNNFDVDVISFIVENCTSLQELNISYCPLVVLSLKELSLVVQNLQVLKMSHCYGTTEDNYICELFSKCTNLRCLDASNLKWLNGSCLKSLNENMEELILMDCPNLIVRCFIKAAKKMKNLKHLEITSSIDHTFLLLELIESVRNLEHFVFLQKRFFEPDEGRITFGNLKNLVILDVHNNPLINDAVLQEIVNNCVNIKKLNISGCDNLSRDIRYNITSAGVQRLATLPNLEDLSICYLKCVTDETLEAFASEGKLKRLEIRGNISVTNIGCEWILVSCENLVLFDVSGCRLISDQIVTAAEASLNLRTNGNILELIVGGTGVQELCKNSPSSDLLQLNFQNLCNYSDNPDYVNFLNQTGNDSDSDDEDEDFGWLD